MADVIETGEVWKKGEESRSGKVWEAIEVSRFL
jgi:hypothetical protein